MSNKDTPSFDDYSESYADTVNRSIAFSGLGVDFFVRAKANHFLDIVETALPQGARADVLDVGCGVGTYHPLWVDRFNRLAGVDVSGECVAVARRNNPRVDYAAFDGTHLPHSDASFDAAAAICVFHHVPVADRLGLAREIRRCLRPDGVFALFEHNPKNPLTRRAVNNCPFDADAILLSAAESRDLLRGAGFREVRSRYILTLPAAGSAMRRIDRLFGKLPLGAQFVTVGLA